MRLAELLCPLAAATDAGAVLPPETSLRTALIAMGLGRALDFSTEARSDLLYAGLVRHLGCSATAHEETRLMGDEQELRALAAVDKASPVQMLKGATREFARGRSTLRRAATVAGFLVRAPAAVPRIFAARCEVSRLLGRRLGLSEAALRALDEVHERFDGKGQPGRKRGEALSPLSGVLAVAEWMAMFVRLPGGEGMALATLRQRACGEFDPRVVRAMIEAREEILEPARREAPLAALLDAEPRPHRTVEDVRGVAVVIGDFADLKSVFTLGHSRKVAALARDAAREMGLAAGDVEAVELAGWLHDVGRVSVSNAIWDKPGPLDAGEWEKVPAHPQQTERVLRAAPRFAEVARLAAADHERVDGGGYPRGVAGAGGGSGAGGAAAGVLAAADVMVALREARPHRPAWSGERAAAILVEEVRRGRLDRVAVNAVLAVVAERGVRVQRVEPPRGMTEREVEVLRLLARGLVDKEIAAELGISHRTVHAHNQRIFGKLMVLTRGAAAVFAIENGLV